MVIASIAKGQLTPYALTEANRLLKIGGDERTDDFLTAAVWADDIRNKRPETGPWHYINLHFRTDRKGTKNKPEDDNVVKAIEFMRKTLADKTKPDADRADALRFLMHFVGDLHQPLHAVARDSDEHPGGDRGGNDFKTQPPAYAAGESRPPTNLHSLWDGGVGLFPFFNRPLSPGDRATIELQARTIVASNPTSSLKRVDVLDPMIWAREGLDGAMKVVYVLPEGSVPSEEYVRNGRKLVSERVALAGYRLAAILNDCLK